MTNYNERLDEILAGFADGEYSKHWVDERKTYTKLEAKQALTSLTKKLVAEAKPEVPEEYERDDALSIGFTRGTEYYYDAISNLLKGLEE